jgi:acyl-CoA dehydrogenase
MAASLLGRLGAVLPAPVPVNDNLSTREALLRTVAELPIDESVSASDPETIAGAARRALQRLAQAGLLTQCVASLESAGSPAAAFSLRAMCLVRAALAYRSPLYDLMFVMQGLGSYAVALAGSEAQQRSYLPAVASGEAIAALALTEPEAGSDLSGIRTRARRDGALGYVVDGEKTFISNAGLATHYVLYARTDEHPKKGLTAFLVPAATPGLRTEPISLLCDDHPIGRVLFSQMRLPESARIGAEGQGMALALGTLEVFRPSVGAAAVGMARRALDESVQRVQTRVQFGKPLATFQATQLALAEMATECEAAALLVMHAAALIDAGGSALPVSAMAKLYATEAAQRVVDRALQLHGGSGLIRGSIIERLYRDVRALRIYEGTSEIQKLIIARALLTA